MKANTLILVSLFLTSWVAHASGNTTNDSFSKAKRLMRDDIYTTTSTRYTLYCGAQFDKSKRITLPQGFETNKYKNRLKTWEAEHVLAAENFGRAFPAWRDGAPQCVNSKGKHYKGRKCATKVSKEYRLMQADLWNLYPAIGAVNALRQNYNFTMLPHAKSDFGSCDMRIEGSKVQPPARARGEIARTYLYFDATYPKYSMSSAQKKLMQAWDRQYPVTKQECERAKAIEKIQGNVNEFVAKPCKSRFWF